jgi:transcriptional regulator with XRE-family HTH domain
VGADSHQSSALRAARVAAGLSQEKLAERVNAEIESATGKVGALDGNTISRLERGAIGRPARRTIDALCRVLGVVTETELGFDRPAMRLDPLVWSAAKGKVTPEALNAASDVLAGIRRLEDATSSVAVLPSVRNLVTLADGYAHAAPMALRVRTLALASELHTYAGWLAMDNRDKQNALGHFNTGIVQGVETGSADLISHAISFKGYLALQSGKYAEAATLSRSGRRETFIALRVFDAYQEAWALAAAGEPHTADMAIATGDAMLDRIPDAERPQWAYWYDVPFMLTQRALAHQAVGRRQHAIHDLETGLAEMPPEHRNADWARSVHDMLNDLRSA